MKPCAVFALVFVVLAGGAVQGAAEKAGPDPFFVSVKSQRGSVQVNVRSGPGQHYPVEWHIVRDQWPLEVIRSFEHWRHVRDRDGHTGWVHKSMISGKRYVVLVHEACLMSAPDAHSTVLARLGRDVTALPLKCDGAWCRVSVQDMKGWVSRDMLWGVYPHDTTF
jgi:SH3-like domain-containing protein